MFELVQYGLRWGAGALGEQVIESELAHEASLDSIAFGRMPGIDSRRRLKPVKRSSGSWECSAARIAQGFINRDPAEHVEVPPAHSMQQSNERGVGHMHLRQLPGPHELGESMRIGG